MQLYVCVFLNWLWFLIHFRFVDFRMIRMSTLLVFRISGFPHFHFTCEPYLTLLLNLNFLTQNETCLVDILILGQTFTSGQLFYRTIPLETWHSFRLRIQLARDSNMAAYQQFLKHIYWNFMESGISGIRIWLDLWVSASNALGKPYFWQNLLEIDPLRYSWKYRISSYMRWYKRP